MSILAAMGLALLAAIDCGATTAGDGGTPGVVLACDGGAAPAVGRPVPVACTPSLAQDAGSIACTTASDCQNAGEATACLAGKCAFDECLGDSDCPSGQLCGCWTQFGGNARQSNRCIATACRLDADCPGGQSCSPSYDSRCGGLTGYQCHSAADTCTTDATCCASDGKTPQCAYAPELGHFACTARTVCNG